MSMLSSARGALETRALTAAKAEPMSDTRAIDLLDGKLVTFIAQVNKAGRKAFRSLDDDVKVAEYRYHHLTKRSRKPVEKPPVT